MIGSYFIAGDHKTKTKALQESAIILYHVIPGFLLPLNKLLSTNNLRLSGSCHVHIRWVQAEYPVDCSLYLKPCYLPRTWTVLIF